MNRRKFILGSMVSGALIAGGVKWSSIEKNNEPLTIDFSLEKLDKLMAQKPTTMGEWNLYQVFIHCAQSVEYSLSGYPEHKSEVFKNTAGKVAFSLFSAKGKMTHALNEAIPGAPDFSNDENITLAFDRFRQSLVDFKNYNGDLKPHFAYGQLTKQQYEMAHAMHFNNHLKEIVFTKVSA